MKHHPATVLGKKLLMACLPKDLTAEQLAFCDLIAGVVLARTYKRLFTVKGANIWVSPALIEQYREWMVEFFANDLKMNDEDGDWVGWKIVHGANE